MELKTRIIAFMTLSLSMGYVVRAAVGLCCGAVIGTSISAFVQFFVGESFALLYVGLFCGGFLGAALAAAIGHKEVLGSAKAMIIGFLVGTILGTFGAHIYAEANSREIERDDGGKTRAHFMNIGVAYGVPIGGVVGGALAYLVHSGVRFWAKDRE